MQRYQYRPALCLVLLLGSATAFAQTSAAPGAAKAPAAPGAAKASATPGAASAPNTLADRFAAADVNHDGKLTLEEASGKMPMVARNFDKIDKTKRGYVTLDELQAYAQERAAQRNAAKPTTTN
jgi:EF hand